MLISLVTGGLATLNAAGFLLLAPSHLLVDFIASSSIFGVAAWLTVGILPAAWQYDGERMATLRVAQLWVALAGGGLLLATQPIGLSLPFTAMLASETYFFFTAILLMKSQTRLFQRFELVRQLGNTITLAVTAFAFYANPIVYACGLALVSCAGGLFMTATGLHRPPRGVGSANPREVVRETRRALSSRRLHALLAGRGVEVVALITFASLKWVGATLSLKIGLSIGNALATNARSRSARLILAVATLIYTAGLATIVMIGRLDSSLVPGTFRVITWTGTLVAGPIALVCLSFILLAWQPPDRPMPTWLSRWLRCSTSGAAE